jgi:hypothetical protein
MLAARMARSTGASADFRGGAKSPELCGAALGLSIRSSSRCADADDADDPAPPAPYALALGDLADALRGRGGAYR